MTEIAVKSSAGSRPLGPIAGLRGFGVLSMSQADYLVLVDCTGRQIRPDKRGAITGPPPAAQRRLLRVRTVDSTGHGRGIELQPRCGPSREPGGEGNRNRAVLAAGCFGRAGVGNKAYRRHLSRESSLAVVGRAMPPGSRFIRSPAAWLAGSSRSMRREKAGLRDQLRPV